MAERGEFRNIKHGLERADFSGLRFGTITPTDIDGLIEFEDRCCIFMETKHGDADLPLGQRLALERSCDKWGDAGIVLVMRKASADTSQTYKIATLPVVEFRHARKWQPAPGAATCLEWVERFASKTLGRSVRADQRITSTPVSQQSTEEWLRDYERGIAA